MANRILNVDDTPARLYARTRLLQRSGYDVVEATTGREALAKVSDGAAQLLLLDVKLPDISGLEVCERVKRDPATREIPVVQISAVQVSDLDAAYGVKSGADFYVVEPVRDESLLIVIDSLLARRKIQEQIEKTTVRELLDSARAARRAQEETLATLGHELRDPLHALGAWLSMLRESDISAAERERALERMQRIVNVQSSIVNDLLDVARIRSGKLSVSLAPMSLERAVVAAIDDMHPVIVEKNINLCMTTDGAVWINGDQGRIGQVVRNVLANAIRFTAVGGNVNVSCFRVGAEAELCVADDGEGIASDLLPHIFEPFRQVERAGLRPQSGLGLGLAIVAHIVREHGGRVSVASPGAGKGATITIRLPATAPK